MYGDGYNTTLADGVNLGRVCVKGHSNQLIAQLVLGKELRYAVTGGIVRSKKAQQIVLVARIDRLGGTQGFRDVVVHILGLHELNVGRDLRQLISEAALAVHQGLHTGHGRNQSNLAFEFHAASVQFIDKALCQLLSSHVVVRSVVGDISVRSRLIVHGNNRDPCLHGGFNTCIAVIHQSGYHGNTIRMFGNNVVKHLGLLCHICFGSGTINRHRHLVGIFILEIFCADN